MSFLSEPECSTAGNPLSQFTKHVQDDKSLQRDRLAGIGPGGIQESFRSQRNGPPQDEAMQSFLQQGAQLPSEPLQPFSMEQMRRDLDGYRTRSPPTASPLWASEYNPQEQARMEVAFQNSKPASFAPPGFSQADFQRFQHKVEQNGSPRTHTPSLQTPFSTHSYQRPIGMQYGMGMSSYRPMPAQRRPTETLTASKGKGRMVELDDQDWESQFAQMDTTTTDQSLDAEANAAVEAELNDMDRSVPLSSETNLYGDFESIWRGIQAETSSVPHSSLLDDERMHMSDHLPLDSDLNTWDTFDSQYQRPFQDPQLGAYVFEPDNPFATSSRDPWALGQQIIAESGNLSLAALAFEAAVQRNPEHVEAWVALGSAQAQNEKETPAIRALEQALKLDESNLEALMGLAISYTNDGWDSTAYRTLERWLATKYPNIISPDALTPDAEFGFTDRHILHERVTELFIRAAQLSPDGEAMDPDVQVGLGVLFYGQEQYSKAVDCFNAALASTESGISNRRAEAHLLWNRLGATLANSGRSEEATDAYHRALELKPNFVRARYNLGVSCINMDLWEQAAGHLLGAMSMHRVVERVGAEKVREVVVDPGSASSGAGAPAMSMSEQEIQHLVGMNDSSNLLETLRRVFGNMGRRDLVERVVPGMDVEGFRGDFDF